MLYTAYVLYQIRNSSPPNQSLSEGAEVAGDQIVSPLDSESSNPEVIPTTEHPDPGIDNLASRSIVSEDHTREPTE